MIGYFHAVANRRRDEAESRLLERLTQLRGIECTMPLAHRARHRVCGIWGKHGEGQEEYAMLLDAVKDTFSLDSVAKAEQALFPLIRHTGTVEEHGVVVMLTCTLLEKLLEELLILMLQVREGYALMAARKRIGPMWRFDERKDEFKRICKVSLACSIEGSSAPKFWHLWLRLTKVRNRFVHGDPGAINAHAAEDAFQLAENSVAVFGFLQNQTCLIESADASYVAE